MRPLPIVAFALSALAVAFPTGALAVVISPGYDPFRTLSPTFQDFGPTPIPADFFDPGSDPFVGWVTMNSIAIGSPVCSVPPIGGGFDFVIERKAAASLPDIGDTDVVPIEIVQMNLVSVIPITVTYNGGQDPELWRVDVTLPSSFPGSGQMTISKTHPNGGTFSAEFHVQPRFTFTRASDNSVRVLEGMVINDFLCPSTPWVHDPGPLACPTCGTTNFFPGIDPAGNVVTFQCQASSAGHTLASTCSGPVGTEDASWGAVKALYRE